VAGASVARLTQQLADQQQVADRLGGKLEARRELANKALVDLSTARAASTRAQARVATSQAEIGAVSSALADAQRRVDQFVAAAYEQGAAAGSLGLIAQAGDPDELIERAQLVDAVARDQRGALDSMREAQIAKVNADSLVRKAKLDAQQSQVSAEAASRGADAAVAAARSALQASVVGLREAETRRAAIEHQLDVLTAHNADLRAQRNRYLAFQRELAVQAEAKAKAAAKLASAGPTAGGAPSGGAVASVISRALSKVGVTYAWGGGDTVGATRGIRDGGEADSFGDFRKTGFDCSGLMMYAFGAAGIDLPHYSGYQYDQGKKVPVSQAKPGDLLFWAESGDIHHVALYLGDGRMVEAPYSGGQVRVTDVRYRDGLMPYAVRLI
jgi:cell wall-associated NlpC family hydrolase